MEACAAVAGTIADVRECVLEAFNASQLLMVLGAVPVLAVLAALVALIALVALRDLQVPAALAVLALAVQAAGAPALVGPMAEAAME